jgi:hypothetical protein
MTYSGLTNFPPQVISMNTLPLIINQDAEQLMSMTKVTKRWDSYVANSQVVRSPEKTLLYLFNADLSFDFTNESLMGSMKVAHTVARDAEGNSAYMAYFGLENVITERVSDTTHKYRAYLTSMNVYSEPKNSPFVGLVNTWSEEVKIELGYPYLPPLTFFKERQFPLQVNVETTYMTHDELRKVVSLLTRE